MSDEVLHPPEEILDLFNVPNKVQTPADIASLTEWAKEKSRLIERDPLNHSYPPYEGQMQVHRATDDEILMIAANRAGKSTTGMREMLWRATGTHPYKKIKPHEVIWCGFLDFPFYNKVTRRLFDLWCPKDHLIQFHESEKWATFKRADGGTCTVYFLSYESGRESWQGGKVDFVWLDEELPEEIYKEASARLIDANGQMLLTQTPVSGLGWAYDTLYLPALSGVRKTRIVQIALAEKDPDREFGVGEPLVPHLTRKQIVRFASIIKDPDERDIRIFGEFKGRSGGVYKQFDPAIHVVPKFRTPPYFEFWGGVDPGYHGFAAVILTMDHQGKVYVVEEFFSQQENHTTRLKELWEKVQKNVPLADDEWMIFYCDTANPQDILELNTWAAEVGARIAFAALDQGLKARAAGIQRVQEYLQPLPARVTPEWVDRPRPSVGEPMMYFFDTLHSSWKDEEEGISTSRVIWELQRYTWKKAKRNQAHPDGADEASAGGAHAMAALRYALMARIGAPPKPEDEQKMTGDSFVLEHMRQLEARITGTDA